jgi:type I restriction enzyme S subunit
MKADSGYSSQTMEDQRAKGTDGSLPAFWQMLKIADVVDVNPSRPPELRQLPDDFRVTFVPMQSVCEHAGAIVEPIEKSFGEVKKGFTYFAEDDVIFAKITPCMQNGKAAIARGLINGLGFGSTEFHVLRTKGEVLPEWLYYFVRQKSFRDEAQENFRGSAGQQRVPAEFLANHKIPLPPLQEQHRIVERIKECLSRVDEIKRLREEARREAEVIEASAFADYLTETTTDNWSVMSLGDVLLKSQYGTSQKALQNGKGYPILRMGNIKGGHLDLTDLKYIDLSLSEVKKYRLERGDILINRTNSLELVGKSAVFGQHDGDWVFASYLVRLVVDRSRALPEFVNAVINSRIGRTYVYATARRAIGMVNINAKAIANMPLPLPPLNKQEEVVSRLKDARRIAQALMGDLSLEAIEALPSSVLRKAFAGEL